MHKIVFTKTYLKHFTKFSASEQKQIMKALKRLAGDPAHPALRAKRIKGHPKVWECSANMDIRIIWQYEEGLIILALDVGHHDILKKY